MAILYHANVRKILQIVQIQKIHESGENIQKYRKRFNYSFYVSVMLPKTEEMCPSLTCLSNQAFHNKNNMSSAEQSVP